MFTESELERIVSARIEHDEVLGTQKGGGDHIGHKSYAIDKIGTPEQVRNGWEVTYSYTIIVETEFTIYPDNPPHEYRYEKTITLDDAANVTSESEKKCIGSAFDDEISNWVDTLED